MTLSVLDVKTKLPPKYELTKALGPASNLWEEIDHYLVAPFNPLTEEWIFSVKNYNWALWLKCKNQSILYLTPRKGSCLACLSLGEKAIKAALDSTLPESVKKTISDAK